jgi:hypothetical protein
MARKPMIALILGTLSRTSSETLQKMFFGMRTVKQNRKRVIVIQNDNIEQPIAVKVIDGNRGLTEIVERSMRQSESLRTMKDAAPGSPKHTAAFAG